VKTTKTIVRVALFLATVAVLILAGLFVYRFLQRGMPTGSRIDIGLGEVPGANDVLIKAYLDTNAERLLQPAGDDDTPVTFVVYSGETATDIAARLQDAGLVSDAELFRRYVQYHGIDAKIEAGEFTLRQTMTIPEVAEALQEGRVAEQAVTIQEGLRLEQVAATVAEQTTISEAEFLALATAGWRTAGLSYGFLAEVPPDATLEGFLFPETYRLPEDATAMDLLTRMLNEFDARVTLEMRGAAAGRGLSLYDLVTLASIVEREAVLDEERPSIAGVYHNRLRDGWLLGACPTVQYAIGTPENWWPQFTLEMTEVESPYNTYLNLGLPPGPICSVKNDGSHLFAVTEQEHLDHYAMCGGGAP
jgi:UPF0755 protein